MADFFNAFGTGQDDFMNRDWTSVQSGFDSEPEFERTFMDRLFAPFEAPQQGLFALTTGVAEDGFQLSDLTNSMGHAARYFNPWSNEERIEPEEVRQIFFGDMADQSGMARLGTDLAISLLYDPLLFAGAAKGLGLVDDATKGGQRAYRTIQMATNPADAMATGLAQAARKQIGPMMGNAAKAALGEKKAERLGINVLQHVVNRYAGVDPGLRDMVMKLDQSEAMWRTEAFDVLKKAGKMRGVESQKLLAEALENEAVWLQRAGRKMTANQTSKFTAFQKKLEASGTSEDIFYQVFDRMRQLDDKIGEGLWKKGLISRRDFEKYQGTHLRRMFEAFEKPLDYIDRMDELMKTRPDLADDVTNLVSVKGLRHELKSLGDEAVAFSDDFRPLRDDLRNPAQASMFGQPETSRYFDPKRGNAIDTDAFSNDLLEWLRGNSGATVDDVFSHIQDDMLAGTQMSEKFWEKIGGHLSGASYTKKGVRHYRDMLHKMSMANGHTFQSIQERAEIVGKRQNIRPEILEALGEIKTAGPRIASQASDAGRLLETRTFLDNIAGVQRVGDETGGLIQQAQKHLRRGEQVPDDLMRKIRDDLGDVTPDQLMSLDTGAIRPDKLTLVGKKSMPIGSTLSSPVETAKHTLQLPDSSAFGSLAGMWTTPGNYLMLRRLEGVGDVGNPTSKIALKTLDLIRNATGHFKVMKVIMDPSAQFRNFVGNAVLMDMQGVSPLRVDKMINTIGELSTYMRTGKMGRYLEAAQEAGLGLFEHTFSRTELQDVAMHLADAPVNRKNWKGALQSIWGGINKVYEGTTEAGMKTFEFNEQLFKLRTFSQKYDEILSGVARQGKKVTKDVRIDAAKQAGALAEQALFNYADVPYLVDFARKYGVVPFATFPFKAAPYVAETLFRNPHRMLKYHRTVEQINGEVAGSPEDVAKEIQALPQYQRENLVLRLPFKDEQKRPLFADLSYFLPWYTIQDLKEQAADPVAKTLQGKPTENFGDFGLRGGMLSPPIAVAFDAIRRNEDSLGRPVWKPEMSSAQKLHAVGKWWSEFWMPPSALGMGSRSDSVGRALQAAARNDPEVSDWVERLGYTLRGGTGQDNVIPGWGQSPQTQAQIGGGTQLMQALGSQNADVNAVGGALAGLLTGGATASDPQQARSNAVGRAKGTATDIARQVARIRSNESLSPVEKRRRIVRLLQDREEMWKETRTYLGGL